MGIFSKINSLTTLAKATAYCNRVDKAWKPIEDAANYAYQINKEENGEYKDCESVQSLTHYKKLVDRFGEDRINAMYGQALVKRMQLIFGIDEALEWNEGAIREYKDSPNMQSLVKEATFGTPEFESSIYYFRLSSLANYQDRRSIYGILKFMFQIYCANKTGLMKKTPGELVYDYFNFNKFTLENIDILYGGADTYANNHAGEFISRFNERETWLKLERSSHPDWTDEQCLEKVKEREYGSDRPKTAEELYTYFREEMDYIWDIAQNLFEYEWIHEWQVLPALFKKAADPTYNTKDEYNNSRARLTLTNDPVIGQHGYMLPSHWGFAYFFDVMIKVFERKQWTREKDLKMPKTITAEIYTALENIKNEGRCPDLSKPYDATKDPEPQMVAC